jgi:hypothetical protein
MNNRRRIIIIIISVAGGTALAALVMSRRYGTLSPQSVQQLVINFLFAMAIVIGIGFLLRKMSKDKDKSDDAD